MIKKNKKDYHSGSDGIIMKYGVNTYRDIDVIRVCHQKKTKSAMKKMVLFMLTLIMLYTTACDNSTKVDKYNELDTVENIYNDHDMADLDEIYMRIQNLDKRLDNLESRLDNLESDDLSTVSDSGSQKDNKGNNIDEKYKNLSYGDTIQLGHYEQDNLLWNGSEPITWKVIYVDNDSKYAYLLSEYGLDYK